jgi:hypothetical protein
MTKQTDYPEQLTRDSAAVPFINNQTTLSLGVQSIDTTLLKTSPSFGSLATVCPITIARASRRVRSTS